MHVHSVDAHELTYGDQKVSNEAQRCKTSALSRERDWINRTKLLILLATPAGFEPATPRLGTG